MRVLLISDIHSNLEALDAVLAHAGPATAVWILGDVVGYGPDPESCIDRLRELKPEHWLAGNHDLAATGTMSDQDFNSDARAAIRWTGQRLNSDHRQLLSGLASRCEPADERFTLAHGSPRHPVWEYVLDAVTAAESFDHFERPVGLVGHTHVPAIYEQAIDGARRLPLEADETVEPGDHRWLVNPGSVGQPRDGDPRASYMIVEDDPLRFTLRRVEYDARSVQAKIVKRGLPTFLAARLTYGW